MRSLVLKTAHDLASPSSARESKSEVLETLTGLVSPGVAISISFNLSRWISDSASGSTSYGLECRFAKNWPFLGNP